MAFGMGAAHAQQQNCEKFGSVMSIFRSRGASTDLRWLAMAETRICKGFASKIDPIAGVGDKINRSHHFYENKERLRIEKGLAI